MFIQTANHAYPCTDYHAGAGSVRFLLPGERPERLGETVELRSDDGNLMAVQYVDDWLRWVVSGSVLVLTNMPEPEPAPDPEPQPPTELEQLRADVDYLSAMTGVMLV